MTETPVQIWRNKKARNLRFVHGMDNNPGNMLSLGQRAEIRDPALLDFVEQNLLNDKKLREGELETLFIG